MIALKLPTLISQIFSLYFAFPAYIRFPDKETPDFFLIFQGMIICFLFCEEVSVFEMPRTFSILDTVQSQFSDIKLIDNLWFSDHFSIYNINHSI